MSPKPITENTLFYGDNLFILLEHIPSESVDLFYLDPPFNSSRNYNVLLEEACEDMLMAQYTLQNRRNNYEKSYKCSYRQNAEPHKAYPQSGRRICTSW